MKRNEKWLVIGALIGAVVLGVIAFAGAGCSGVPRKAEQMFYDVETNAVVVPGADGASNVVESYTFEPNETAQETARAAGEVAGFFGPVGELVSLLVTGGFGLYGVLRSKRAQKTAGVLAQIIQTGRNVLEATPQGQAAERAWVDWMTVHQAETGVLKDVADLLSGVVDEATAREAAERLLKRMQAAGVNGGQ